jgi:hypothetical protein
MKARKASLAASLLTLVCLASSASAQPMNIVPDEFGTQDGNDLWIPASQFTGEGGWALFNTNGYFPSNLGSYFWAGLPLPQGAHLDSWRAFYYDNSATNEFNIDLLKWFDDTTGSPNPTEAVLSSFTSSGTPGFSNHHQVEDRTIDLREPSGPGVTRSQAADLYSFRIFIPLDLGIQFKGVRVVWHRQVSPSPATATFNDVPASDPAFQYIEALVASGVTAGCSTAPPKYCPDATLTRRQMAVFLAKALGLHWPNF